MDNEELKKVKKELMKPYWTEELHHCLEDLQPEDARKIVESMTHTEVYRKVNNRRFQEDYISDYLEYLWKISESAYWRHLIVTLDTTVGLLWGGDMPHFEKMCTSEIPAEVLKAVLNFAFRCDVKEDYTQDFEAIGCVVKAQVERFGRINEIKKYISSLNENLQESANKKILEMIKCRCNYTFYS